MVWPRLGAIRVFLEAAAPRVNCSAHGPTVRQVPWARHGAGHTRSFDQQVAWLATQCSKRAITELMRIAWRTVGAIITGVWADTAAGVDAFAGLQRIGIDEISYKPRHKYLTVVVDHDSGRLVWASPDRVHRTSRSTAPRTVRAVEDPEKPHRPPTGEAGVDRQARPSALPRLPPQGRLAHGLQTPRRPGRRGTGQLGRLGTALPHRIIRHAPTSHRGPPRADPGLHRPWPIQRAHRVGQHQDPTH